MLKCWNFNPNSDLLSLKCWIKLDDSPLEIFMVLKNTIFELQRQILKMVSCCLNTPSWYGSSMATKIKPHVISKKRLRLLLPMGEFSFLLPSHIVVIIEFQTQVWYFKLGLINEFEHEYKMVSNCLTVEGLVSSLQWCPCWICKFPVGCSWKWGGRAFVCWHSGCCLLYLVELENFNS